MSDQVNENIPQQEETNEAPLEFYIDQDSKLTFPTLAYSALTSTDELCRMAKVIFQNFADYYGISVNFNQNNGALTLSVHFAQIENQDPDKYYAFEPNGTFKGNKESGLRRIQQFEKTVTEGNKFTLSENGKSAMAKYMSKNARDQKGDVKWGALGLITQYSETPFGGQTVVCNVINFVSPIAVLRELYGDKARVLESVDENGQAVLTEVEVDYEINVLQSLQQPNMYGALTTPPNEGPFKIDIRQINKVQLKKAAKEVGVNISIGRNIIR